MVFTRFVRRFLAVTVANSLANALASSTMLNVSLKKISTQLLLSYAVPLACLGGLGLSAYFSAKETFFLEAKRELLNEANYTANDATYHLINSIREVKGNVISPNESRYLAIYQMSRNAFVSDIQRLNEIADTSRDEPLMALVNELEAEGTRIDRVARRIFVVIQAEEMVRAAALTADLKTDSIGSDRDLLLGYITERLQTNADSYQTARAQLNNTLMWGTVFATLITIGIGLLLTRQIRQKMNQIVRVVEQNGIQVTTSSTQIAASSHQLEASMTEQVAATTQITATTAEIAATAEVLTQTIERVSGLSELAATTATAGKQDLENMAETIQQLIAATATISSKLGLIDDKANNISAVVTAITKVADQTNLLSLNAAIEAEKAGEYGAGFSVVAREIRRLADQTAIATLDIETMVQEMLSSVSAGVMEMDKFTQDVGDNAESITQISQQMAQIIYQVQSLVPQFETVSDGMLAQAQGAQQIKAAMEQLNETSQQTADSVKDTNQVILQLGDVAQDLQTEVAYFRLAV